MIDVRIDNFNSEEYLFVGLLQLKYHSLILNNIDKFVLKKGEKVSEIKRDYAWQIAPNLLASFKYAMAGINYTFITQRNFRIHLVMGSIALSLGAFLHISHIEMAIIALTSAVVLALELLNTAIESVVDLTVKQSYHELAKIAKDCAAGAVLMAAVGALIVAGFILLPPLLALDWVSLIK